MAFCLPKATAEYSDTCPKEAVSRIPHSGYGVSPSLFLSSLFRKLHHPLSIADTPSSNPFPLTQHPLT